MASARSSVPRSVPRPFAALRARALASLLFLASASACAHGGGAGREAPSSLLTISTAAQDADVWVDGEYIGQVEAVSGKLRLRAGVHRVEIRKPGHFPVQRTVRVEKKPAPSVVVEAELLGDPR